MIDREEIREEILKGNSGVTDSNGNLILPVFRIPVGKIFRLNDVVVWADGYDPANPLATGWFGLFRDANCTNPPFDFEPKNTLSVIPAAGEYRKKRFHSNECITLKYIASGTVATTLNITCMVGGYLIAESGVEEKVTSNA
jgi:hypothetical protein